jgi:hypothetical protein
LSTNASHSDQSGRSCSTEVTDELDLQKCMSERMRVLLISYDLGGEFGNSVENSGVVTRLCQW